MTTWSEVIGSMELPDPSFDDEAVVADVIILWKTQNLDGGRRYGITYTSGLSEPERVGLLSIALDKEADDIMEGWME